MNTAHALLLPALLLSLPAFAQSSHVPAHRLAGKSGNVVARDKDYGGLTVLKSGRSGFMEWELAAPARGEYYLQVAYASAESRPCRLELNAKTIAKAAFARKTGGWRPERVRWDTLGPYLLEAGAVRIRVSVNDGFMPHFSDLMLCPARLPEPKSEGRTRELNARRKTIAADITRLRERLTRVPADISDIRKRLRDLGKQYNGSTEVPFILRTKDVENVVRNRMFGGSPSPFDSILAFHKALKVRGTDLIVVPCPSTTQIYAHKLMAGVSRDACIWPAYTEGVIRLLENDVEVVDLVDQYRAYEGSGDPVHFFDHHWGVAGMDIAARELKARFERYEFCRKLRDPKRFSKRQITAPTQCELLSHNGILPYGKHPGWMKKKYNVTQFLFDGAVLNTNERMQNILNPVLIMGDSAVFHLSWQHGAVGCGFPEHVSYQLGFPVSQRPASASASRTSMRFAREFARQSPQPRVVIFAFVTYELCVKEGGGWTVAAPPPAIPGAAEPGKLPAVKVVAAVAKASKVPDPKTLDYADALGVTAYRIERVHGRARGLKKGATVLGLEWAMRGHERIPAAARADGEKYELELIPWRNVSAGSKLGSKQMFDDTGILDAPMYWVLNARLPRASSGIR